MIKINTAAVKIWRSRMTKKELLRREDIEICYDQPDYKSALLEAGKQLVKAQDVSENYLKGMLERENVLTTYIGNGIAVPHAEGSYEHLVYHTGMAVRLYPKGIDWNGNIVYMVAAIASPNGKHIVLLQRIAERFGKPEQLKAALQHGAAYVYENMNRS